MNKLHFKKFNTIYNTIMKWQKEAFILVLKIKHLCWVCCFPDGCVKILTIFGMNHLYESKQSICPKRNCCGKKISFSGMGQKECIIKANAWLVMVAFSFIMMKYILQGPYFHLLHWPYYGASLWVDDRIFGKGMQQCYTRSSGMWFLASVVTVPD